MAVVNPLDTQSHCTLMRRWIIICVALGGLLLIVTLITPGPPTTSTFVVVQFCGLTNSVSGTNALFSLSNGMKRDLGFAAANVQIRDSNGWPTHWTLTNGPAYEVPAGVTQIFVVSDPPAGDTYWRVPIIYARMDSRFATLLDEAKSWLGIPHLAKPFCTNTPEMHGLNTVLPVGPHSH
jgi:hypothetical protein